MNRNLNKAKASKMDEFYTQLTDVEKEMRHYTDHFKGKVVYSNCDREDSAFVKFFTLQKDHLGLKDFIHYDGDFRSPESIALLEMADIVVTNPPFSLFREYIAQLMAFEKNFIVIGNMNAAKYKEIWPFIRDNKIWLGINRDMKFPNPYKEGLQTIIARWYTNLSNSKRTDEIPLYKRYNKDDYPMYENINAIEVSTWKSIPFDYEGVMGVPITFLDVYNPNQFDIVGLDRDVMWGYLPRDEFVRDGWQGTLSAGILDGKEKYARILIKRRIQQ